MSTMTDEWTCWKVASDWSYLRPAVATFSPLIPLRVCDFIDSPRYCHAERKRGPGRGGVEAPQVCLRCHHRRHIFDSGVVKRLAKRPALAIVCGVLRLRSASPLYAQMTVGKKSQPLRMTAFENF